MRIWTAEARAAHSAFIKQLKPWTKSTGPKTPEGKAKAAKNSFKTGRYSQNRKNRLRFFRQCRAFLKFLKTEYYTPRAFEKSRMKKNLKTNYYKSPLHHAKCNL